MRAKRAGERVLKLSRQPYYRWLAVPIPEADVVEAYRANALFDAHRDDPEFGYRYLADEAEASEQPKALRTAWRLCSSNACQAPGLMETFLVGVDEFGHEFVPGL